MLFSEHSIREGEGEKRKKKKGSKKEFWHSRMLEELAGTGSPAHYGEERVGLPPFGESAWSPIAGRVETESILPRPAIVVQVRPQENSGLARKST